MKLFGRLLNPVIAFIGIQLAWLLVVIFWIYWFMGKHRQLRALAEKYSPELLRGGADWFILTEGLLLLAAILAGVYVIFLFWRRQAALYRDQRKFIAQISHELKSPLASLQLHLETIRRRRPPAETLDTFLDTMLADTDRLGKLINNLLSAQRLEQKEFNLTLQPGDLSNLVAGYFRPRQYSLPQAGRMELEIEPGLRGRFDAEALETVFRNLLENALLYAAGAPQIRVCLHRQGNRAHLVFADRGRGIERKELGKVFRMFYRVRHHGETIRGSGLGLFIVQTVVRLHGGKVWVESAGLGQGTTFHILLPLAREGQG
jgi:signal transduction histidine kinase